MEQLVKSMRKCLANTFVFYFKTHGYHWNVEGINFPQYHEFLGNLYESLQNAVDPIAEQIRALGEYAPSGLNELYADATIVDSNLKGDYLKEMLATLLMDNDTVSADLNEALALATASNKQGLVNFLADRIDQHAKHGWMLRSSLKGTY
jgi:starvation-inducible DNA-binding protein